MDGHPLVPPEDLRPAQLGVVLVGRVLLGHISATVADLAVRGYLRIEGSGADWVLTDLRQPVASGHGGLLSYEGELLAGLFDGHSEVGLPELAKPFMRTLDQVRSQLIRDAVRRGWLSRWRHETRTRRGEQLLAAIQDFRRELRAAARTGGVPPAQVPYAMVFGLSIAFPLRAGTPTGSAALRGEPEVPGPSSLWSPSDQQFALAWQQACSRLAGNHGGHRPGEQWPGFAHQWSQPHHSSAGHDHTHGTTYGGHDTTYGDHGGSSGGHAGGPF
jgi:hypothetical protein